LALYDSSIDIVMNTFSTLKAYKDIFAKFLPKMTTKVAFNSFLVNIIFIALMFIYAVNTPFPRD